jgi:hypothetical protein
VSRGVAAVIDFLVVGVILAALYLGVVLTTLMFHSTAFSFPSLSIVFSRRSRSSLRFCTW